MGERVVEVELQALRHPLMQAGQQAIVVRIALVAEVELTRELGIKAHVGWQQPELVQQSYCVRHVAPAYKGLGYGRNECRAVGYPGNAEKVRGTRAASIVGGSNRIHQILKEGGLRQGLALPLLQ